MDKRWMLSDDYSCFVISRGYKLIHFNYNNDDDDYNDDYNDDDEDDDKDDELLFRVLIFEIS